MATEIEKDRSLHETILEFKQELTEFARTRIDLFSTELHEKATNLKLAAPLVATGALFLGTGYLLLTLALVSLIMVAFADSPYRWFFAFLIVAGAWLLFGGMAALMARRVISKTGLIPQKTLEVLRADKRWLHEESNRI